MIWRRMLKLRIGFPFEKAIMANSLHAHRLLHLAKSKFGKWLRRIIVQSLFDGWVKYKWFRYFESIGTGSRTECWIHRWSIAFMFTQMKCSTILMSTIYRCSRCSFLCFDNKYAVSGAQHVETLWKRLKSMGRRQFDSKVTVIEPQLMETAVE
jgi:hypothetical protein